MAPRSPEARTYRACDVVVLAGASLRQLQHWRRAGIVVPSVRTPGGHHRYSEADRRKVELLVTLTRVEPRESGELRPISVRRASAILNRLHGKVERWIEAEAARTLSTALSAEVGRDTDR